MRFKAICLSLFFIGLNVFQIQAQEKMVQNWLLCGPFLKADLESECFSDEALVSPKDGDYSGGKMWKTYNFVKDVFDLEEKPAFGYQDRAVGYAYVEIQSPKEGWIELQLGSDDGIKVWWNGKTALVNPAARAVHIGEDKLNLKLNKGPNKLLLKISDIGGGWGFSTKIVAKEGISLDELVFNPPSLNLVRLPVKKVRGSTVQGGDEVQFNPKYSVDADMSTRWSSEHYEPQWYEVYFTQPFDVNRLDLYWENAFALEYKIAVTQDGENWKDVYTQVQGDGGHEIIIINPPEKAVALRFFGKKKGSEWGMSFWEFEVYGKPEEGAPSFEDTMVAIESEIAKPYPVATVTVSSEQPPNPSKGETFTAANAADNNSKTRWSSSFSDPQEITLDLGEPRKVHQIVLLWETACAKSYKVEISMDAVSWETVYETNSEKGGQRVLYFDNAKEARYVRMVGTERATTWGYSLWEFQVF